MKYSVHTARLIWYQAWLMCLLEDYPTEETFQFVSAKIVELDALIEKR